MKTMYHVRLRYGQNIIGMFIEAPEHFASALDEINIAVTSKAEELHDRYAVDLADIELLDIKHSVPGT